MRRLPVASPAFLLLIVLGYASSGFAADEKALQTAADEAAGRRTKAGEQLESAEKQLTDLNTQLITLRSELAKAPTTIKKGEEELKKQQAEVTKLTEEHKKAVAAQEAAAKAAEDAKGSDKEKATAEAATKATEAAKAAEKKLQDAQAAVAKTEAEIAAAKKVMAESEPQIKQVEAKIAEQKKAVEVAQAAFDKVDAEWLTKQQALEKTLIEAGKLVSFRETIAPIFAKRCLACHNARTAKGRYNMETFAAVMKGGESGEVIDPGDGDFSTLYAMVEDGSMPKEADPLTKEQLASIKQWINTGAKLDAGVDPNAQLITIMPKEPQPLPPQTYPVPVPVTAVAFSPDGKQLATSGYHEVLLWNVADGKLASRITNVAERVYDIEFTADGSTIAVAAGTPAQIGEVKLFQVSDGKLLADLVTTSDSIFAVAFSPDEKRIATAGADRAIQVFDMATKQEQLHIEDHADWVMDIAWSPDGTKLASASRDKTSKLFDMKTGESLATFNSHSDAVFGAGFTPDGNQVISSGSDRQIRLWTASNAKQVRNIGFGGDVFEVVVSKDGRIFSCSADKTARIHNSANGSQVHSLGGHTDWVYSVAFSETAKTVAAGSYNGEVRIWNAEDGKELLKFTAAPGLEAAQASK